MQYISSVDINLVFGGGHCHCPTMFLFGGVTKPYSKDFEAPNEATCALVCCDKGKAANFGIEYTYTEPNHQPKKNTCAYINSLDEEAYGKLVAIFYASRK